MQDFLSQNLYEPWALTRLVIFRLKNSRLRGSPLRKTTNYSGRVSCIGYVHDQGAAMHGGIAGHAGLFSTANDLAKRDKCGCQKGTYGGNQYFKPETLELFAENNMKIVAAVWVGTDPLLMIRMGRRRCSPLKKRSGIRGLQAPCIWVDPAFNLSTFFFPTACTPT